MVVILRVHSPLLLLASGLNKRKCSEKYRCKENKDLLGVHTKRNIAEPQDVYDYGTLTLPDVSICTVSS